MKLVVKPTTKNIKSYQEKGVNTFLFALEGFSSNQVFTFTFAELKEYRKDNSLAMYVLFDRNFFEGELSKVNAMLKKLSDLNIDGLFFYDLAVLKIVHDNNYKIPLIWNQNFLGTNTLIYDFYKKEGVNKAVISSEITLEEIKEITSKAKVNFILPVFGYPLMAISRRSFIKNYLTFLGEKDSNEKHFLIEKDRKYPIVENDAGTIVLNDKILNLLPVLEELPNDLEILCDETEIDHDIFLKVLDEYNSWIKNGCRDAEVYARNIANIVATSLGFLYTKTIYKVKK